MGVPTKLTLDAQDEFSALFEGAPVAMYMHDLTGVLQRVNRAFERITGYSSDELLGRSFFDLITADSRKETQQQIFAHLGGESAARFPVTLESKTGQLVHLELALNLLFTRGAPSAIQGCSHDISAAHTLTRYLQLLHRLSSVAYSSIHAMYEAYLAAGCEIFQTSHGSIRTPAGLLVKSWGRSEAKGIETDEDPRARTIAETRQTLLDVGQTLYLGTPVIIDKAVHGILSFSSDSGGVPVEHHPQAHEVLEMMATNLAAAIHQRQLADLLEYQATHDALTSLPNRLLLQRELDRHLADAASSGSLVAVVFLDLDRFKQINDTLGHGVGDTVLEQLGRRLKGAVRTGDTLARMGGDEFTAVVTSCADEEAVDAYARALMAAVRTPCRMPGRELFITASVGISLFPRDGADAATLLRNADRAMYAAKYQARNDLRFYKDNSSPDLRRRLELETGLRRALERSEFQLQFQPQVDLEGRLASLEALLVWENPEFGRIGPAEFIPIAEDTGMIVDIGSWVLGEVCRRIAEWESAGLKPVPVAVNVSALQFAQPDLVPTISDALRRAGAPASALELELTESLIMRDTEHSANIMRELRSIGVTIAIDDFGTGYSSISYLRRLPADSLKIDKSFLQESEFGPASLALIRAVVALAHSTGLTVTAEGVESSEQLELIREAGCDRAQGHLFGTALPADAVERLLRERFV